MGKYMLDNNGQSAAKLLKIIQEEGSTTIPRKGSTVLNKLEKEGIEFRSIFSKQHNKRGVYALFCISNNKVYIGSCNDLHARIIRHTNYLKRDKHHSQKLQRSFNKYGSDSLYVIFLEEILSESVKMKEEMYINMFDSVSSGFNNTSICIDYKPFKLDSQQIENRAKHSRKAVICLTLDGEFYKEYNSVSEAAKAVKDQSTNISSCCKGKLRYVKDFIFIYKQDYNKHLDYSLKERKYIFSEEHRRKMSQSQKGRIVSEKCIKSCIERSSKPVSKFDTNRNLIVSYSSLKDCCEKEKIYVKTLHKYIANKTPLGGFYYELNKDIVYSS